MRIFGLVIMIVRQLAADRMRAMQDGEAVERLFGSWQRRTATSDVPSDVVTAFELGRQCPRKPVRGTVRRLRLVPGGAGGDAPEG